ncbi:ABC transporter substrate-binding protein, partial [Chloroflexota bacterium]
LEAKDPYTLIIHQKIADTSLFHYLSTEPMYSPVACKQYVEAVGEDEANENPVGSGPYRLVEGVFGDHFTYEAKEEHWRIVPEFKYLTVIKVPEESTRIAMLKTGQIDATPVSASAMGEVPKEGFEVESWPGRVNTLLHFGGMITTANPHFKEGYHMQDPWVDIRVREAMNISIDREAMNQAIEKGTATLIAGVCQWPGWEELEPYPYDPERAKKLMSEAGYPNGFDVDIISMPPPGAPLLPLEIEAIAGYWEENLGLKTKIIPMDFPAWNGMSKELELAGIMSPFRMDYDITAGQRLPFYFMPGGDGRSFFEDEEQTVICEKILAEPDPEKQKEMLRELSQWQHDNYACVPVLAHGRLLAKNTTTLGELPRCLTSMHWNLEYWRHAKPLNTFRLFNP